MRITTVSWWHYSCTLKWSMCLHTVTIRQHAWIGAVCQISASALFVLICDSCQIKTVTWLVFLRFSFIPNTIKKVLNITLLMLKEPGLTDSRIGPRFVDLLDCHCPKFSISLAQNWSYGWCNQFFFLATCNYSLCKMMGRQHNCRFWSRDKKHHALISLCASSKHFCVNCWRMLFSHNIIVKGLWSFKYKRF